MNKKQKELVAKVLVIFLVLVLVVPMIIGMF